MTKRFAVHIDVTSKKKGSVVVGETLFIDATHEDKALEWGNMMAKSKQRRMGVKAKCVGVRSLEDIPRF